MSKELNAPEWLDDVIAEHAQPDGGVYTWVFDDVRQTVLVALQRYETEHQARRPWSGVDSKSDYGAFVQWIANNHGLTHLQDAEYQTLYRLFCEAYGSPAAPGSETGDRHD